jgi:hypothetical protein
MKAKLVAAIAHAQQSKLIIDPEAERIVDQAAQAEGGDIPLGMLRMMP